MVYAYPNGMAYGLGTMEISSTERMFVEYQHRE
jgi:hypothetical protein